VGGWLSHGIGLLLCGLCGLICRLFPLGKEVTQLIQEGLQRGFPSTLWGRLIGLSRLRGSGFGQWLLHWRRLRCGCGGLLHLSQTALHDSHQHLHHHLHQVHDEHLWVHAAHRNGGCSLNWGRVGKGIGGTELGASSDCRGLLW
jgi:hypothetical protein